MKNTNQYLNAIKSRYDIRSDYKLARLIGVAQSSVSNYRHKRSTFDTTTAARIAELLNISPLEVIAASEIERAVTEEAKEFWKKYAGPPPPRVARTRATDPQNGGGESLHN